MWIVIVGDVAHGPFGGPEDVDAGHRQAQAYADAHTFATVQARVLPLVAPAGTDPRGS